ncbi:hypothetical protein [Robertkochia sediminum]|uniref:hypothetical protein n=1 Tax=Robertkochia sediminum TaxID=2785326 RepID=UPI00193441BD|nr:hypothetical protein [Robertkochia sediminum]MBL7472458.1 hypothetical protein [Robertkochia sediminum]
MKSEEFDKQVRSALEHREIQPSENAWEKLQSQLDEQESGGSNSQKIWWFAAAVAGIILIVSGFLYTPDDRIDTFPIAEQEAAPEALPDKSSEVIPERPVQEPQPEGEIALEVTDLTKAVVATPRQNKNSPAIAPSDHSEMQKPETIVEELHEESAQAVVAVADEVSPDEAYNKEVDALLEAAMREVGAGDLQTQKKVDAAALLADVEEELDRNFKDKALDAIKKKIVKLRSAVADRNE